MSLSDLASLSKVMELPDGSVEYGLHFGKHTIFVNNIIVFIVLLLKFTLIVQNHEKKLKKHEIAIKFSRIENIRKFF